MHSLAPLNLRLCMSFALMALAIGMSPLARAADDGKTRYTEEIEPLVMEYCLGCHGLGTKKGGVSLDEFPTPEAALNDRVLWHSVLKNVRAGLMPPAGKPRPTAEEIARLEEWVKRDVFLTNEQDPDPGRVTLRRLNRVEYRNTIRDLMGIDFRTDEEFPADDAGYGFDNIGDVLTVSPLLLEKYMQAAETIVTRAVPTAAKTMPVEVLTGSEFRAEKGSGSGARMSYYEQDEVAKTIKVEHDGTYRLVLELEIDGVFDPDPGRCRIAFSADGRELLSKDFAWADEKRETFAFEQAWKAGEHRLTIALTPLEPAEKLIKKLDMKVNSVKVEGPLEPEHWSRPKNFDRFFSDRSPSTPEQRREYSRDVLSRFAGHAFRRPVDDRTLDRLVAIAESSYADTSRTTEAGIAQAMTAVLASPRFLFRIEETEPPKPGEVHPHLDEYALASRLSYFLWSTMPDEELEKLASTGKLRKELHNQVKRMLADPRSQALVQNFTGQWLQIRDVEHFPIQPRPILRRDGLPAIPDSLIGSLRRLMKQETEMYFSYVIREDRSILDLLDSDYTFANEQLARHYGIPGVTGREMKRVELPEGSPRGGLLAQAGVLMITSNPTRTSPVKRGQFILENILGTPTPPPPPDIPALEEARQGISGREPTVREVMALHRSNAICSSCHSRMDPLGLSLENFNALGMWRETESKQPIDASGTLLSGKSFKDIRDLKAILKTDHRADFYRCLTEKLMTYALGRGIEYYDVATIDRIVNDLERHEGRFSTLLLGIIDSSPFQKRRQVGFTASSPSQPSQNGAKP